MKHIIPFVIASLISFSTFCQTDSIEIEHLSSFLYTGFFSSYTSALDENDQPYVYTAANELGLIIFNVEDLENPIPVDTFPRTLFQNSVVTNFTQVGDYLYLSIGGFQGLAFPPGMAIIDISNPAAAQLKSIWISDEFDSGAAIVIGDDDYAYIGAMEDGVLIMDVSNKEEIKHISTVELDLNWPEEPGLFSVPHARGMTLRDDIVYVTHDAGGMRVIDVSDKNKPEVIDQFMNFTLKEKGAPAYNNIVLNGSVAYVAVDYCGVEVLDISDPSELKTIQWLDPWDCDYTNWDGRPGHTNQLAISDNGKYLFVSGADTEVVVYSIQEDSLEFVDVYGVAGDNEVTWGVSVKGDVLVLSLVNNPIGIPYDSNIGGIRLLRWRDLTSSYNQKFLSDNDLKVYPNPSTDYLTIDLSKLKSQISQIQIFSADGRLVSAQECYTHVYNLSTAQFQTGLYFLLINSENKIGRFKFFKK